MNVIIFIAKVLVIVGALNWGLVGAMNFDLIERIFGHRTTMSRILYILVGISAIFLIILFFINYQ